MSGAADSGSVLRRRHMWDLHPQGPGWTMASLSRRADTCGPAEPLDVTATAVHRISDGVLAEH
jgi:hypothetical protein